jgi:hypothetical protein
MIRRLFGAACLLSLLLGLAAAALWAADWCAGLRFPPVPSTYPTAAELLWPLNGFNFTGGRLQDLLGSVQSSSPAPLYVDWDALEPAGAPRTARVDYQGHGTCLGEVLAELTTTHGLAFTARDNTVLITTRAALAAPRASRASLHPWRFEWDHHPHRWTLTVHGRALHLWRTPVDPALAFPPTVPAVAARQKQCVAWTKDYRAALIEHDGYPYECVRFTLFLPETTAAASPLPAARLLGALLRTLRRKPGVCRRCGYDLRATPQRCPECGTVANASRERANA